MWSTFHVNKLQQQKFHRNKKKWNGMSDARSINDNCYSFLFFSVEKNKFTPGRKRNFVVHKKKQKKRKPQTPFIWNIQMNSSHKVCPMCEELFRSIFFFVIPWRWCYKLVEHSESLDKKKVTEILFFSQKMKRKKNLMQCPAIIWQVFFSIFFSGNNETT